MRNGRHLPRKRRVGAVARAGQVDGVVARDVGRAAAQHHDLVGQEHGFFDVVRHEQHGRARRLPHPDQLLLQVAAGNGVDRAEGFVHQQQVGLDRQRAGDAHALRLAARQLVRPAAAVVGQAGQLQRRVDTALAFRAIQAQAFQPIADIAAHRAPGHQAAVLEHHRAAAASGPRRRLKAHFARSGLGQPGRGAQQRRLAHARSAHHCHEAACLDIQRQALDDGRGGAGVLVGQLGKLDYGRHCSTLPSTAENARSQIV